MIATFSETKIAKTIKPRYEAVLRCKKNIEKGRERE
jgi:hypothetical protein